MKKIKDWFIKHKNAFKNAIGWIFAILLAFGVFFQGYCLGVKHTKPLSVSAEVLTSAPSDYHYPLKFGVVVDDDVILLNKVINAVNENRNYEDYLGSGVSIACEYSNIYSGLLYPIVGHFSGDTAYNTVFNKIELEAKYFKYVAFPLLSLGVSQSDIQNSYSIYLNDTMKSAVNRVYCSYSYNINESDRVVNVINQVLEPYLLSSALNEFPSQYQDNAFMLFPSQPFGSPSYDGIWLINPFRGWDDDKELSDTFIANIYNFRLVIEFKPFVNSVFVDDYQHLFAYCSFLYDYSANFPTRVITNVSWLESIANSVDSFLEIEILPDLSFYDILILCVVIPLVVALLVAWLGG